MDTNQAGLNGEAVAFIRSILWLERISKLRGKLFLA